MATDISANRISVVSSPVLVAFNLQQNLAPGGIVARWQFVGEVTQNVERAFTTGIVLSKPMPEFSLLASRGDSFSVRVNGYFDRGRVTRLDPQLRQTIRAVDAQPLFSRWFSGASISDDAELVTLPSRRH